MRRGMVMFAVSGVCGVALACSLQPEDVPAIDVLDDIVDDVAAAPDEIAAEPDLTTVEGLLKALRDRGETLERFTASSIKHEKYFYAQDDYQIRFGSMGVWRPEGVEDAGYRFGVTYTMTQLGLGVGSEIIDGEISYIFNGSFLIEIDVPSKQYIARRVVPVGEKVDPFKLGEGQFPLPIGQDPDEIQRRFDVTNPAVDTGFDDPEVLEFLKLQPRGLEGITQVRLVTRDAFVESFPHREYRFWVDKETLTPVMIRTVSKERNEETWQLFGVKVNADAEVAERFEDAGPPEGFKVVIHNEPVLAGDE